MKTSTSSGAAKQLDCPSLRGERELIGRVRPRQRGFTITEMMVTAALGLMVIAGSLMGHMAGLRMSQLTSTKLGGNDDARQAIGRLVQDIRAAKMVKVGNGDASGFTSCGPTQEQKGNAIQIYPTTSTNVFVRYFKHTDNRLRRMTNGSAGALVLASFITNNAVFTAENYKGIVSTNNDNNRVIGLTMQFYQIQYPVITIGTNQLYDFYQVRTRVTRRTLE